MTETRSFDGPAGRLDARLHGPPDGAPVLLLHPHPRHGGSMGTRFVYTLARALADAGWRAVRFDFRGVGRSDGAYDEGRGETEDAVAVWDALAAEGDAPAVVGFSFGAAVAIRLAGRRPVPRLVLVAPPRRPLAARMDPVADARAVGCPAHVLVGSADEQVPVADAKAVCDALPAGRFRVLDGVDHLLTPTHHATAVAAVLAALAGPDGPPRP